VAAYLIVNADDFNLTGGVTRGILEAHLQGIVTSTTVMVNLPGLEQGRSLARQAPRLGVGLHLNLTFGPPVLPAREVPSLVDDSSWFIHDKTRFEAAGEPAEIRAELSAQARRFQAVFGRRPSHLDSHHHIHRHPRVFEVALALAGDLGVGLRAIFPEMVTRIRGRGLSTPDRMVGDIGLAAYWSSARLVALVPEIPPGVPELMCHPGHADGALVVSSYSGQREEELRALCDPTLKAALRTAGVALISYDDLASALVRPP
jgi:predicted glycoside hydrolase/deacetylase ChbG (UPF0249 family)